MFKTSYSLQHPNLLNWIMESSTFMTTLFSLSVFLSFIAKLAVCISNKVFLRCVNLSPPGVLKQRK